jgi:hydroxymethylglutaryl-CoA reductase
MHETVSQADILRSVTALAVAEMQSSSSATMKSALNEACEALISTGLIPIGVAPEVWRCCNEDDETTVKALRNYINAQ